MVLFFLVPYVLPYFISPIFSQAPLNESQLTPHVLHADALENKPIFLPASNSDHQTDGVKVDNPVTNTIKDIPNERRDTEPEEFINHHADIHHENVQYDLIRHESNQDNEYLNNDAANQQNENPNNRNVQSNNNINFRANTYSDGSNRAKPIKRRPTTKKHRINRQETDDGVVFVPERNYETLRNDDDEYRNINDVMNGRGTKKLYDIMEGRNIVSAESEAPSQILFVSGKNKEDIGKGAETVQSEPHEDARRTNTKESTAAPIDCINLNCDMTTNVVCGVRKEDNQWRFRIFKNQCFFRKVNCRFSNEYNRYLLQPLDKCKHIGRDLKRSLNAPSRISPWFFTRAPTTTVAQDFRRRAVYRRSQNLYKNGATCQHVCPSFCGEDYAPQCAVTDDGKKRVFLNHCKLDHHSCTFNTVWHERPLSDCVGENKADVRQNRGFIGWMQRVGIVDGKGKLVIE